MAPFNETYATAAEAIGADALGGVEKVGEGRVKSPDIRAALGPRWWVEYYQTLTGTRWTVFTNGVKYTGAHRSSGD